MHAGHARHRWIARTLHPRGTRGSRGRGAVSGSGSRDRPDAWLEPTSRCGLVGLGQRLGPLALEAGLSGYELQRATAEQGRSLSAFGGGKLYVELEGQLEAFARGGVERTWLSGSGAMADYQGDGAYVGIGAELRLVLPLGQTSLWVDYTRHQATLRAGVAELDASAGRWTVGLSIGL